MKTNKGKADLLNKRKGYDDYCIRAYRNISMFWVLYFRGLRAGFLQRNSRLNA